MIYSYSPTSDLSPPTSPMPRDFLKDAKDEYDVIVIDPDTPWILDPDELKSKCKNTPFDEAKMTGRVVRTIVAGRTAYEYA